MYILQEFDFGFFKDLYSHADLNYITVVREIMIQKHPTRKYRIVEVIEVV